MEYNTSIIKLNNINIPTMINKNKSDNKFVILTCSDFTEYFFRFNKSNNLEYCNYYGLDSEEILNVENMPNFKNALETAIENIKDY